MSGEGETNSSTTEYKGFLDTVLASYQFQGRFIHFEIGDYCHGDFVSGSDTLVLWIPYVKSLQFFLAAHCDHLLTVSVDSGRAYIREAKATLPIELVTAVAIDSLDHQSWWNAELAKYLSEEDAVNRYNALVDSLDIH